MSKYTITPWRHPSDLLQVRSQLYPSQSSSQSSSQPNSNPPDPDPDPTTTTANRLKAVNRIMAWKLRGNLPHAVESTALLTDAILHHQQSQSQSQSQSSSSSSPSSSTQPLLSPFSIRAVYSAAFTRFVTGFCDIGRSRERLLEPSSMLDIARKIGMPVGFVGLRHEATHEELPGLGRLVRATEEGLGWLWEVYWSRLKEVDVVVMKVGGREVEGVGVSEGGVERVREVLKGFRGERKVVLKRKGKGRLGVGEGEQGEEEERTARICVDLVGGSAQGMERLVQILVEDKLLIPSKREIGDPLDGAYLIWDRLLKAISTQQKRFLPAFVKVLRKAIGDTSTGQPEDNVEKEALCMWLVHTTNKKKSWTGVASSDLEALRKEMVKWSCTHPGYWSHFLGSHLIKAGGPDFANIWEDVLEASRLGDGYFGMAMTSDAESEEASSSEEEMLEDEHDQLGDVGSKPHRWRRAAATPKLPIGVV